MVYSALAPLYDRVMDHVEYDEWLDLIKRIAQRYLRSARPTILEVGGGTGQLGVLLKQAGFGYCGSDICFEMCSQAGRRHGMFFCADGRSMPLKKRFDWALFLYDGINYLRTPDDYRSLFHEMYSCLNPGGLFLFDITTETNSLHFFQDSTYYEDYEESFYVRHSYYDSQTGCQHNDFTIFSQSRDNPSCFVKTRENHVQRVFAPKAIASWVPRERFSVLGIWDGFSFNKHSRRSERVHFLLRRVD